MTHKEIMNAIALLNDRISSGLSVDEYCKAKNVSQERYSNAIETIKCYEEDYLKIFSLIKAYSSIKDTLITDMQIINNGVVFNFPKGTTKEMFIEFYFFLELTELGKM